MKKSEKLFLLINEIDDKTIDEAKGEAEKPVKLQVEKRMPLKSIIAFAACFAVLAVAIFALVKFKLNSDIDPIDSDSSDSSSDQSFVLPPDIELSFTEQDRELQAILKDLTANAEDIDRMFYKMSIIAGEPDIADQWNSYYRIPEGTRTEPNGLHTVPQSCAEMEELLLKYFSKRAVEFYMGNVGKAYISVSKASVSENSNFEGDLVISFENLYSTMFTEIDGKMYRSGGEWSYDYSNLGIDCATAKVTRQTDKAIEFTYWGYDDHAEFDDGDTYSERTGALVYEDGAWKLNYFYHNGFISEMPNEYTDQDLELQDILKTLEPGEDVRALFSVNSASAYGDTYKFVLPGNYEPEGSFQYYTDVSGPQGSVKHPKSLGELEEMLLEYFTRETTDTYMSNVCKGTMTENPDGSYNVTLDKDVFFPVYIEIDGKMFYRECAGSGYGHYNNTAKVVEQTDDTIIYSCVVFSSFVYQTETRALRYERGGWKHDDTYRPEPEPDNPGELIEDDKALQALLKDLVAKAEEVDEMFTHLRPTGNKYTLDVNGNTWGLAYNDEFYLVSKDQRSNGGLFAVPQSYEEMESLISEYFSSLATKYYMNNVYHGTLTEEHGDRLFVDLEPFDFPVIGFVEMNGKMYYSVCDREYLGLGIDCKTAKITRQTDTIIEFTYWGYDYSNYYTPDNVYSEKTGFLVKEDGTWKLRYLCCYGFAPEVPLEYTEQDLALHEILESLKPGNDVTRLLYVQPNHYKRDYNFVITDSSGRKEYYNYIDVEDLEEELNLPRSCDELEQRLLGYFSRETTDYYMNMVCKGTSMIQNEDGSYSVTLDKDIDRPIYIEMGGKMYYIGHAPVSGTSVLLETAKVIEQTDDTIVFSHARGYTWEFEPRTERLVFERGGWKRDVFYQS